MPIINKVAALLLLPMFLFASPALAQHVRLVDAATMSHAIAAQAASEVAQRDLVRRVLDRADARSLAASMGLTVQQADSAVAALGGSELGAAARHAGAIETAALVGGANTIVISVTTLLLILIIVILLAK